MVQRKISFKQLIFYSKHHNAGRIIYTQFTHDVFTMGVYGMCT